MAGSEARSDGTFIIEPIGSNIHSPTSFTVRKRFQSTETTTSYLPADIETMFDDILDQLSRPTASGSNMKGGILFLKNGTYELNAGVIDFSDTTDDQDVSCKLSGETRENTIIKTKSASGGGSMIDGYCNLDVENITLDGNNCAQSVVGIGAHPEGPTNKILKVRNIRSTKMGRFDIITGHNCWGLEVANSIFDTHDEPENQVAFEDTGWAHIYGNLFDKTSGNLLGESLTSGTVQNAHIHHNRINRTTSDDGGISIEAFSGGFAQENIYIHDNMLTKAGISIGNSNTVFTDTMNNIVITNNFLYQGGIRILGCIDPGDYSNSIKNVFINGNTLYQPWTHGIQLFHVAGPSIVRNNTIHNSNTSSSAVGANGLLQEDNSTDVIMEDNSLYMDANADTDVSPHGIWLISGSNLTIRNNRIINRNATNPSYKTTGSQTGTNLISRNL